MLHILSGRYLTGCMGDEIGLIPLSFIPISNIRLIYHQIQLFRNFDSQIHISISLPKSYSLLERDCQMLSMHNVEIIWVNHDLSQKEELLYVLENASLSKFQDGLWLLQGDTLPVNVPHEENLIAVEWSDLENGMHIEEYGVEKNLVYCGLYRFSNILFLKKCFHAKNINFYAAIKQYSLHIDTIKSVLSSVHNLGSIVGYYRARSAITSERAFNTLHVKNIVLSKFSKNTTKITAESNWFEKIPSSMRHYIPQYISSQVEDSKYSYSIEYLPCLPLNELYVYGRQTIVFWNKIFSKFIKYFSDAQRAYIKSDMKGVSDFALNKKLFIDKTLERVDQFSIDYSFDLSVENTFCGEMLPGIDQIIQETAEHVLTMKNLVGFLHGDLCFSNILYDSRSESIKLIDPRGIDNSGSEMLYGSIMYDVAKLSHSVIGLYDYIIANQYELSGEQNVFDFEIFIPQGVEEVQSLFFERLPISNINSKDIYSINILLFLSMLPLHYDDPKRQRALLANALRLYKKAYC